MNKQATIALYGGALNAAKRLGITHQAVYKWPETLPRSAERAVRKDLADFLKEAGQAR